MQIRKPARGKKLVALASGVALLAAMGWLALAWSKSSARSARPPVIVLMDTSAPGGVYDANTRQNSGTNADDLSDDLRDLPVELHKETVGASWDREDQIVKQMPDLIVIHRSAFFHSMDLDFRIGYPPFGETAVQASGAQTPETEQPLSRAFLYDHLNTSALIRLQAFLGYAGLSNLKTRFLIYSRGAAGGWAETAFRHDWVQNAERRFPVLKGRIFTINVRGGDAKASFRDPATIAEVRKAVASILGITTK